MKTRRRRRREKRCPWCNEIFTPHPRLGGRQITCGNGDCIKKQQYHNYKRWVRENLKDHHENQHYWREAHPDYWKAYRRNHTKYTERNRIQSKLRKSLSKTGLQNKLDILQLREKQIKFWNFPRFAKQPRSLFPLLFAYRQVHGRIQGQQKPCAP